jgi:hypothetical protein
VLLDEAPLGHGPYLDRHPNYIIAAYTASDT